MNELIIKLILYLTPLYITNAMAMLFGGSMPLDFNRKFKGKPLLGKGKTIEGTFTAIAIGITISYFIGFFFRKETFLLTDNYLLLGSLLSIGAVAGDIIASFMKRRINLKPGEPVLLLDQLDFIAGGMLLTAWIYIPSVIEISLIIILTLLAHKIANFIAYKIKIKKVPW